MIKLKYLAGYCEVFSVFEESPGSFCDSDTVFAFSSVFELSEFFALESVLSIALTDLAAARQTPSRLIFFVRNM